LGFRECSVADAERLTIWLAVEVCEKERCPDQAREAMFEWCRREKIEPEEPVAL
jgi:hypothetical protein